MNKYLYWFILGIMEIFIVAFLPILLVVGVSTSIIGWFSIIPYVVMYIRDRFKEKYETAQKN